MNVFTRYFRSRGYSLRLFDIDLLKAQSLAEKYDCAWSDSFTSTVSDMGVVLLCTPIKDTPRIIQDITPHLKVGSILCEVSSLKMGTIPALKAAKGYGIKPLSVHPMFGPDVKEIEGQTIIIVSILDQVEETNLAGILFPDTKRVVVDAETHDQCMASILSLPYFMNLAFARALPPEKLSLMRELAGTTFTVQLAVTQSIVGESPELIESLINDNVFSGRLLNRFIDESRHLRRLLRNDPRGFRSLCESLSGSVMSESDSSSARELRNWLFEVMKTRTRAKVIRLS